MFPELALTTSVAETVAKPRRMLSPEKKVASTLNQVTG